MTISNKIKEALSTLLKQKLEQIKNDERVSPHTILKTEKFIESLDNGTWKIPGEIRGKYCKELQQTYTEGYTTTATSNHSIYFLLKNKTYLKYSRDVFGDIHFTITKDFPNNYSKL